MTLTDRCDSIEMETENQTKGVTIGENLQEVVWQAMEHGRLISGVQDCARQLEIDPYNVMLCILPADSVSARDVSTHINHMLIEAVCREYDIRLIKVDSLSKLTSIVKNGENAVPDNAVKTSFSDISCLIVQYPNGNLSKEEKILGQQYENLLFNDTSQTCLIILPD